jgi:AcrR family transcriptional regulator
MTSTRHTEATRKAILDAAAQLFMERRSDGFSVQEVADRVGLTHRTVYRYFPTRQELMAVAARHLAPEIAEEPFRDISSVEDWIEAIGPYFTVTEAHFDVIRSVLAAVLAADDLVLYSGEMGDRDAHRWHVFRTQFPHLAEDDGRRTFAALRHLMSSTSYVLLRLRFGMSPAEATETIQAAASQIVEQAERRDRATARGKRR